MDTTTAACVVPGSEVTEPSTAEQVEPAVKATLNFQQMPVYAIDKGKGVLIPVSKEKLPSRETEGDVISSPTAPMAIALEEGGFALRDDYCIPLSADVPAGELTEEQQLVLALKASIDIAPEERAA